MTHMFLMTKAFVLSCVGVCTNVSVYARHCTCLFFYVCWVPASLIAEKAKFMFSHGTCASKW